MSNWLIGAAIGALGGLGIWLIVTVWARQKMTLSERIAPYVLAHGRVAQLPIGPERNSSWIGRVSAPFMKDLSRIFEKLGSSSKSISVRLAQAGRSDTVERFRLEQVAWAAAGTGLGLLLALLLAARGGSLVAVGALVLLSGVAGALAADRHLSRSARRRQMRIVEELPDVAELVALAIAAGQTPLAAIERVATISSGELSGDFRDLVARVRTGTPLIRALEHLRSTTASPELGRFADAIVIATERGTPLAEVLRSQAQDIRENSRQRLMEIGGTKEIAMMAPVVLLVLPVTVLFALFPGLVALRIGL